MDSVKTTKPSIHLPVSIHQENKLNRTQLHRIEFRRKQRKLSVVTQTHFSHPYTTFTARTSKQTSPSQVIHTDNGKKQYSVTAFKDAVISETEHK